MRRPWFRFLGGKAEDGGQPDPAVVKRQVATALVLQEFYFLETEQGRERAVEEFRGRHGLNSAADVLGFLRGARREAGIQIVSPAWFAGLLADGGGEAA